MRVDQQHVPVGAGLHHGCQARRRVGTRRWSLIGSRLQCDLRSAVRFRRPHQCLRHDLAAAPQRRSTMRIEGTRGTGHEIGCVLLTQPIRRSGGRPARMLRGVVLDVEAKHQLMHSVVVDCGPLHDLGA